MNSADRDFFNLHFKDVNDNIKHESEQRDQFINHAYAIDRRLRAIERCCKEYFGIDPALTEYAEEEAEGDAASGAESTAEGQADAVEGSAAPKAGRWIEDYETQEALAVRLFSVFHNESIEDSVKLMEVSPRYGQWLKLAYYIRSK